MLRDRVCAVPENPTGKSPLVFKVLREIGNREPTLIESKVWRTIVALCDGIVEGDRVRTIAACHGDTAERMVLSLGTFGGVIGFPAKVTDRE